MEMYEHDKKSGKLRPTAKYKAVRIAIFLFIMGAICAIVWLFGPQGDENEWRKVVITIVAGLLAFLGIVSILTE